MKLPVLIAAFALLALLAMGNARAQKATGASYECYELYGGTKTSIQLPPSVTFTLGKLPPVGTVLYESQVYSLKYVCYSSLTSPKQAVLTPLAHYSILRAALKEAGLKLQLIINGNTGSPWNPDTTLGGVEYYPIGPAYTTNSGPQTLTFVIRLSMETPHTTPARFAVPSLSAFKIVGSSSFVATTGLQIDTTAVRLQFAPACIGKVSVDPLVHFVPVITAPEANHMGTLPQQRPFNITASTNPLCALGNLTQLVPTQPPSEQFHLRLTAAFVPQGTERIGADGASLILRNDDGQENGLRLRLLTAAGVAVPLNPPATPPKPDNFGALQGAMLSLTNTYTAELTATGGELKMGNYHTTVLVRMTYQ